MADASIPLGPIGKAFECVCVWVSISVSVCINSNCYVLYMNNESFVRLLYSGRCCNRRHCTTGQRSTQSSATGLTTHLLAYSRYILYIHINIYNYRGSGSVIRAAKSRTCLANCLAKWQSEILGPYCNYEPQTWPHISRLTRNYLL